MQTKKSVAIIGIVGIPGSYGGFETLAENLVKYAVKHNSRLSVSVYCAAKSNPAKPNFYHGARLRYLPISANGVQSILYDIFGIIQSIFRKDSTILVLGVSGAIFFPIARLVSSVRIITNIDGIEWKREKWGAIAKAFLHFSEWIAVRFSHIVITDNQAIYEYVEKTYRVRSVMIPYGGDHSIANEISGTNISILPSGYALSICRIEPENNVSLILDAFSKMSMHIVFVGNWNKSSYGHDLKEKYSRFSNITLLDPVYDPDNLRNIRNGATMYIHGHSAGGTNPSLVEMMFFSIPVFAHGCAFNRFTTENSARYFLTSADLVASINSLSPSEAINIGSKMAEIACRRYRWDEIGKAYFNLL